MPKDILLYGSIDSWSSTEFINRVIDADIEDINVRINSPGGDVQYGWGIIAKIAELAGKKLLKNDGKAHSMAAFMFCYADDAEALDTAEFIFHRAAYASWIESNPEYFDDAAKAQLERINTSLRKAMEAKVDSELFATVTGVKIKDIFSMDGRVEVALTAKQAKQVGLINRVVTITPKKKTEISALMMEVMAKHTDFKIAANHEDSNSNKNNMTIEKLKTEHPSVYAQIFGLGETSGIAKEKDRIGSFLAFVDVDPKGVKEAIASNKTMTETERSEFAIKAMSKKTLAETAADGTESPLKTKAELEAEAATAKAKELKDFEDSLDSKLGLKKA